MESPAISIMLLLVAAVGVSAAAERPAVLPRDFAGWHMQGTARASRDAGVADPAYASLLKEYGFTDLESANYRRDDGRTLAIKAARFESTSGAVGAYTFYRQPGMQKEQIGEDRKSTRLNSSHVAISYAVFCLKKKNKKEK